MYAAKKQTALEPQDPTIKAQSQKQQMAAGAALSAKRGERSKGSLKGASKKMEESMTEDEVASTKRKKLPKEKKS